jgi:hypothetical protein
MRWFDNLADRPVVFFGGLIGLCLLVVGYVFGDTYNLPPSYETAIVIDKAYVPAVAGQVVFVGSSSGHTGTGFTSSTPEEFHLVVRTTAGRIESLSTDREHFYAHEKGSPLRLAVTEGRWSHHKYVAAAYAR